jgi:hypothetical protein
VLEELMGQEILDETDRFIDNEQRVEVNEETRWVGRGDALRINTIQCLLCPAFRNCKPLFFIAVVENQCAVPALMCVSNTHWSWHHHLVDNCRVSRSVQHPHGP